MVELCAVENEGYILCVSHTALFQLEISLSSVYLRFVFD